jgi:hypothetical protein
MTDSVTKSIARTTRSRSACPFWIRMRIVAPPTNAMPA